MGCWSPFHAMKAYMHALKLNKDYYNQDYTHKLVEPKCMEFLSALAAGNRSQLMVEVASGSVSTSTLALAVAGKHLGSRIICIRRDQESLEEIRSHLESLDLRDVIELKVGDPCEVIKQYKNIDFAVVDHRIKECVEVLFTMDMNPNGSVVVVSNLFNGWRRVSRSTPFGQMMRGRGGNKTAVLPIGDGIEITWVLEKGYSGRRGVRKSCKRAFMVYED